MSETIAVVNLCRTITIDEVNDLIDTLRKEAHPVKTNFRKGKIYVKRKVVEDDE